MVAVAPQSIARLVKMASNIRYCIECKSNFLGKKNDHFCPSCASSLVNKQIEAALQRRHEQDINSSMEKEDKK